MSQVRENPCTVTHLPAEAQELYRSVARYARFDQAERLLDHADKIMRTVVYARDRQKRHWGCETGPVAHHANRLERIAQELKLLALDLEREGATR